MSVYRPKRSSLYLYDFVHAGRRFHGSTGQKDRRSAEAFERRKRQEIAEGRTADLDMSLDVAAGEWWQEVGSRLRSAATVQHRVATLLRCIDPNAMVSRIRTVHVSEAIKRRRALDAGREPSNTTINRDIIDTLRPILRRAARIHEIVIAPIDWTALRLREPREIVREFTPEEIERWGDELGDVERVFLGLSLTYGMRFGEMFFPVDALRLKPKPILTIGRYKGRDGWRDRRKDGSLIFQPLKQEHAVMLAALADRSRTAGLEIVWADADGGRLTEITYWGMRSRLVSAAARARIAPGRIIHGMRHHAGTALLRATGNLILVQRLLGHRQITTTQRYAHATEEDLRAALEQVQLHNREGASKITKKAKHTRRTSGE